MIEPIILPKIDATGANLIFNLWLEKPVILWVVLGEGSVADIAVAKALELINSDEDVYKSSRVIHALNPSFILEKLKSLPVNPRLSDSIEWDTLNQYIILSISVNTNTIGGIVLKSKYTNQPRGYINRILREALSVDAE